MGGGGNDMDERPDAAARDGAPEGGARDPQETRDLEERVRQLVSELHPVLEELADDPPS